MSYNITGVRYSFRNSIKKAISNSKHITTYNFPIGAKGTPIIDITLMPLRARERKYERTRVRVRIRRPLTCKLTAVGTGEETVRNHLPLLALTI